MGSVQSFMLATFDDGMNRCLTTTPLVRMLFKVALNVKLMKL